MSAEKDETFGTVCSCYDKAVIKGETVLSTISCYVDIVPGM